MGRNLNATWDPALYLQFGQSRQQPAQDLLARLVASTLRAQHTPHPPHTPPSPPPQRIADLGCGPGNSTALLRQQWPHANITGVDLDAAMLHEARQQDAQTIWVQSDLATWQADQPFDLLFSNASLHWLSGHQYQFPRLLSYLNSGAWFAAQMPYHPASVLHQSLFALLKQAEWSGLAAVLSHIEVLSPAQYQDILSPHVQGLEIWVTEYQQPMPNIDTVLSWMQGSILRPLLAHIEHHFSERDLAKQAFTHDLSALLAAHLPRLANGAYLMPFPRLFMLAQRR